MIADTKRVMPEFTLPRAVLMETLRIGIEQAVSPICPPYATECSQKLNSAKGRFFCLDCAPIGFVDERRKRAMDPLACLRLYFEHLPSGCAGRLGYFVANHSQINDGSGKFRFCDQCGRHFYPIRHCGPY